MIASIAAAALLATAGETPDGRLDKQAQRVLVAALADNLDGGELVVVAALVAGQQDRGARVGERALDAGVLLFGQRGFDGRQRADLARFEYGLRGLEAGRGIGGQQRQPAERGFDRAAQPVVDADIVDVGRRGAAGRLSGRRVEQRTGRAFDEDRLGLRAVDKLAVLQRAQNAFGARAAAGDDLFDTVRGFTEVVGSEVSQSLVEACGMDDR